MNLPKAKNVAAILLIIGGIILTPIIFGLVLIVAGMELLED